ncbi:MAG TPA: hypothetical protein VNB24_00610 [Acidimicrobiales bacterium]|nr:hypothetical protein [Acidimicrobiales bacterium]
MKASPGTSVSAQYPALIGSAPTSGAVDLDPATCGEPEAVFCDNVPINVTKGGDLSIEVSWPDTDGSSIDDIDIILYDAGKNGEYTRLDSSESAARPEQINESLPAGLVNLVVVHYAGVNTGYEVLTSMPSTTQTAAAAPAVGAAPAPSTGGGGTVSSPTPPRNRSPFGNRFAAPRAPAPDSGVDFGETAGPGAVSSLGGTPSGNAAVSTAPAPQAAARPTGDAGSDLGWFAWVLAAASPLLIGAVLVLNRRSSRSAPAAI